MPFLHAAILIPFLFCIPVLLAHRVVPRLHTGWAVLPAPLFLFVCFLLQLPAVQEGEAVLASVPWIPSLGVNIQLYLDGLALLFALLITGVGSLVTLYSIFYLNKAKEALHLFYVYLLLFMGAMLGVVLSDNLMVLYGFWELTSLSSFLLIAFWHNKEKSVYGAQKSLLITVFGGFAMFAGFLLLYVMTGTFSIREVAGQLHAITGHSLFLPAMILILLGAFTKSAQFPFHIWLPDAMEAPTPVSAYLHSATMVKAGLYLVARFTPVFAGQGEWLWIVSSVGLLTLLYGALKAIRQTDLKALLAYSTISQLGLIMCLLGLGSASAFYSDPAEAVFFSKAAVAAVFHLLNHAMFKGALFMVVGIIDHETGTRDIRRLGGLMTVMPITFTVAAIGAFSMAGLPPFSGFLSKEMFFTAVLNIREMNSLGLAQWGMLFPVIAWLASIFTFVYSMIIVLKSFTGGLRREKLAKTPHEAPLGMLLPPVILATCTVVFGFFPNVLSRYLIEPAMASILPDMLASGGRYHVHITFWHGWTPEVFMTLGVIAAGTAVYLLHRRSKSWQSPGSQRFSLNALYNGGLSSLDRYSKRLTNFYMTGSVRHYLIYIFAFLIAAVGIILFTSDSVSFRISNPADVSLYEALLVLAMLAAAVAVPLARSRMSAIIFTGGVGYLATLFFVLFRAPDLALTQIIVETVSVTLFLLCFYHLPDLKKEAFKLPFKLTNLLISLGVGAIVTLIALAAGGSSPFPSIAEYYLQESHNLGGGDNVVNVILVDFRGFDTMLEISVLGIASLGIYALIKLRLEAAGPGISSDKTRPRLPLAQSNDVILQTVSRAAVLIILTFSLFLFLAGHNNPGGGFIGGLMTSAALVLLAIAFGMKTVARTVPLNSRKVMAIGLLLAFLTGSGSFLFDAPFMSHAFGYFNLPILGKTELATAVLFDLGVYLAVVGVTTTILFTIGRDR
ncbi:Na+/H+ antiporter subunit A [Paenibacillus sp. YN15]|uniref:Na+/H+ antiporter subunit A n=1 Tax=Paenibacillus sp. YN15 TaxID=1742774 RepID=UPI000DCC0AC0|nr:Na+/H+ antiporter subunit A [Paenibacillus sp. YN15]RAV01280.1 Na+/H+ antiporter subunit A [Paenibacillus sp. YN15]